MQAANFRSEDLAQLWKAKSQTATVLTENYKSTPLKFREQIALEKLI